MTIFADEIFIPGGLPDATYVAREHLQMEERLSAWLGRKQKRLLSLSGPTKSGKTVLLKKMLKDPIRLSGGAIVTVEDFWDTVCDKLELFTEHTLLAGTGKADSLQASGSVNVGVLGATGTGTTDHTSERSVTRGRVISSLVAGRRGLETADRIVVIDDFHYIDSAVQVQIIHGLKDLIFDGLGVVVAAVPHRSYDVVRLEKEMVGRVLSFPVDQWDTADLRQIAEKGFAALKVNVEDTAIGRMANESFGSPHLMQMHCLNYCENNLVDGEVMPNLDDAAWDSFFQQQAADTSKSAFDLLKSGPPRSSRNSRTLKSGLVTDIYGAVLHAISCSGGGATISYEEVRDALRRELQGDLPQRHEITAVLEKMTRIAKDSIEGEPVLEYDKSRSELHIVDPYFAYYLRWAPDSLKDLEVRRGGKNA
ncbi:hypothetical protein AB0O95_00175 [Rhodoglobus sp. NPDC076762]